MKYLTSLHRETAATGAAACLCHLSQTHEQRRIAAAPDARYADDLTLYPGAFQQATRSRFDTMTIEVRLCARSIHANKRNDVPNA